MTDRRTFIKQSLALGATAALSGASAAEALNRKVGSPTRPKILSTWNHGIPANEAAWTIMQRGGSVLDAVEGGVRVVEADPLSTSVGYGGLPDRDGNVTLDACIMDSLGNAGSVCFLQHIRHPISVARLVMEKTPHVMLVGDGALKFALANGFKKENLLTAESKRAWQQWQKTSDYQPKINVENHDTIGMVAMDAQGNLAGSCTTSGLAYKLYGRVGDSPVIGAGLFVDNEVGAAVATGMGELMLKTLGSFLVVELMRQGLTVQDACEEAIDRIVRKHRHDDMQVGYLAMDKNGNTGSFAIYPGFNYAETVNGETRLIDAGSIGR
jgi:N4-(beta-N-acetylglucosaminyl)-L-asparaginase